jgi:hypothetical protein
VVGEVRGGGKAHGCGSWTEEASELAGGVGASMVERRGGT